MSAAEPVPAATLRRAISALNDALMGVLEGTPPGYTFERIESAHAYIYSAVASLDALHPGEDFR